MAFDVQVAFHLSDAEMKAMSWEGLTLRAAWLRKNGPNAEADKRLADLMAFYANAKQSRRTFAMWDFLPQWMRPRTRPKSKWKRRQEDLALARAITAMCRSK